MDDMAKESTRQVLSLLFADLVGFSKIKDDRILKSVKEIAEEFGQKILNQENHLYFNTWGDAFFIASSDPVDLLEISLHLRDWYRNRNWDRIQLEGGLAIRIGIHAETCTTCYGDNEVTDVIGQHVSAAARIEPIVPANSIYCTAMFKDLVASRTHGFAVFHDVGTKELSKGFGAMQLFSVSRTHEMVTQDDNADAQLRSAVAKPFSMTVPRIRKTFSDKDIRDFQQNAFTEISAYFDHALRQLQTHDEDLECEYDAINKAKFTCRIYVKDEQKAACKVWTIPNGMNCGIHYSQTISEHDNSMNESLHVESDGYALRLRTLGMLMLGGQGDKRLSPEEAAHYLWAGLMKQLEY